MTVENARNSWESWHKTDSRLVAMPFPFGAVVSHFTMGAGDLALLVRLACAGGDHGKFARTLPLNYQLSGVTGTFLRHLYTYRAGVALQGGEGIEPTDLTVNCTSVMHTAGRRPFEREDIDTMGMMPDIAEQMVVLLNRQREHWIATGKKKPGPEWEGLVNLIPAGKRYTLHLSCNYAVARSFYQSRANHRYGEWRVLCQSFEGLPYSEIITTRRDASHT